MTDSDTRLIFSMLEEIQQQLKEINHPSKWFDLQRAIEYSACSKSTLQRGIHSGKLKHVKRAGKIRIKVLWLDQWLTLGHCRRLNHAEREIARL